MDKKKTRVFSLLKRDPAAPSGERRCHGSSLTFTRFECAFDL